MNERLKLGALQLLFFLSGTSGLVYEVIWVRIIGLGFGNTVAAVSTVLAAFMAGSRMRPTTMPGAIPSVRAKGSDFMR